MDNINNKTSGIDHNGGNIIRTSGTPGQVLKNQQGTYEIYLIL